MSVEQGSKQSQHKYLALIINISIKSSCCNSFRKSA